MRGDSCLMAVKINNLVQYYLEEALFIKFLSLFTADEQDDIMINLACRLYCKPEFRDMYEHCGNLTDFAINIFNIEDKVALSDEEVINIYEDVIKEVMPCKK